MKPAILILLGCLAFQVGFATKITAIANTGMGWSVPGNWDLNRIPANNDTAIIPAGLQLNVKGAIYSLPYPNIDISIAGVLFFEPSGKLDLGLTSTVHIDASGSINSTGSPSELIRINGVVKYNGVLDGLIPGPATADRFTLASPLGFVFAILPIRFELFTATAEQGKIKLHCKISNDVNIDRLEVERSIDGRRWNKVADKFLNSRQAETALYDLHPVSNVTAYYRLLVFETNVLVSISKVVAVDAPLQKDRFLVHYNEQTGNIEVKSDNLQTAERLSLKVINDAGQVIKSQVLPGQSNTWAVHLQQPKHGVYFVIVEGDHKLHVSYKLVL
jgi:hypothetical protein